MRCPVCIEADRRSTLRERGSRKTLMACSPFHDENGQRHYHDANITTSGYSCSNGHQFTVATTGSCPCGWNKNTLPRVAVQAEGTSRLVTSPQTIATMLGVP